MKNKIRSPPTPERARESKMLLVQIQGTVHTMILNARRLERLITAPDFEQFFDGLAKEEQLEVCELIATGDPDAVEQWYTARLTKDIGELSTRELRIKASRYGVPRYSTMTKIELLQALMERMKNERTRNSTENNGEAGLHCEGGRGDTQAPTIVPSTVGNGDGTGSNAASTGLVPGFAAATVGICLAAGS